MLTQLRAHRTPRAIRTLLLFFLALVATLRSSAQSVLDWKTLLDSGQVFALREAVQRSPAPDLYRGAVLSSCNNVHDATRLLHAVIQQEPHSEAAYRAHDILGNLYQRNGLYKEALQELDAALLERPEAEDMRNVRPLFAMLAASGDMKTLTLRHSKLALAQDNNVPFTIKGRRDSFAFDTGANISVMSEREAAHLGLAVKAVSTRFNDSSGNGLSGMHIAVATRMRIGGLTLRNVPFMVIPDANEPFAEMPPDERHRGLIGLPILLAMRAIRWSPKRSFEFDLPPENSTSVSNLLFHEQNPVVQVEVTGHQLDFTLDTGATDTDLIPALPGSFQSSWLQERKR